MRLDEFIEGFERDEEAERRHLAREKSYEITEYLEGVTREFQETLQGRSLFGSTAPSIFVGRSGYPDISTGVLSPVGNEERASSFVADADWYHEGLGVGDVLRRRGSLLNSSRSTRVHVEDVWDGFVGVQREVAIADRPVDVEIGLADRPDFETELSPADVATPTGPRAHAESATLAENPHVPRAVEKTLEDDDWRADGAMTYLYRRGFDVYEIEEILSAGALGRGENRRLVPTRWSITAVDDAIGRYLRGTIRNVPSIDEVEVWTNEFVGNRYWVILAPGRWEYELVELKAAGSVWNPDPEGGVWIATDYEGYGGRTGYVEETAGAYHAARLGVLEHLSDRGRQAKVLVLRHVSDDYWGPVGVWQVRESIRNAFDERDPGVAETFHGALGTIEPHVPVSLNDLRRSSELVAGLQAELGDFSSNGGV